MPTLRIPPGVVRGESRAHVPGRWSETNLIRWQGGVMKPVGGWERQNLTALLSIPRNGFTWLDTNGNKHRAYMGDAHVYTESGGAYTDRTPVGFVDANSSAARGYGSGNSGTLDYGMDDEDRGSEGGGAAAKPNWFCLGNWGPQLLFSSSADGRVFVWDPDTPGVAPSLAAGVQQLLQGFIVTDEHHLMTFGGMGTPNRVSWSDQDNRTGWDFLRVDGQAGFIDLEGAGEILSATKIPGAILVFTTTSVWIGRYSGAPYFYGFVKLAEGCAPVSSHSVAVAGQRAWWMGRKSWWRFEGGIVAPMTSTLGLDPFESLFEAAAARRVTAGFNGLYPEVWFFYPEKQGDESTVQAENNRYIVYNFEEGWWADGWMHRSFYLSNPLDDYPMAADDQGYIYQHEIGYLAEGQPRGSMVYAEIGSVSLTDGEGNVEIQQAQIDNSLGPTSVKFTFKGNYQRGGQWFTFHEHLAPRGDGYLDTWFSARDFSIRIEGNADGPWSFGAPVFEVKGRGKR